MKRILSIVILLSLQVSAQEFQEGAHLPYAGPMGFPTDAAFGDFNGDGFKDIIEGTQANGSRIWLNDGAYNFTLSGNLNDSRNIEMVTVDIDQDGDMDIIGGSEYDGPSSRIWLNDGNANFTPGFAFGTIETLIKIVVADFNEDGNLDMFCANSRLMKEDLLFINNGDGSFTLQNIPWTSGSPSSDAKAADINNDGHLDIIIAKNNAPLQVRREDEIWFGNGDGTFIKSTQILPLDRTYEIDVVDIDNDGLLDLITNFGNEVRLFFNDGSHLFQDYSTLQIQSGQMKVTDLDFDGDLDILIADRNSGSESQQEIFINDGIGNFGAPNQIFFGEASAEYVFGDIDNDTDIDILTLNNNGVDGVLYINQTDPVLNIVENNLNKILFFPNPISDYLYFTKKSAQNVRSIRIFTPEGKLVLKSSIESGQERLNLSKLSSGTYVCQLYSNKELLQSIKLIKE